MLAGHTVASSSNEDLELLYAALSAIEPVSAGSLAGRKLYDICKSFYQLSHFAVIRHSVASKALRHGSASSDQCLEPYDDRSFAEQFRYSAPPSYEHIMMPEDWDTVMGEFDLALDVGAMASFIEPYMPFDSDH